MRIPLLAMLIASGTTVAIPANACCVQQRDAGMGVTTGSTAGTIKQAPSATSGDLAAKDRAMTNSTPGSGPG